MILCRWVNLTAGNENSTSPAFCGALLGYGGSPLLTTFYALVGTFALLHVPAAQVYIFTACCRSGAVFLRPPSFPGSSRTPSDGKTSARGTSRMALLRVCRAQVPG